MGMRIKELLSQNKLVRVFGMGQLCHPKLVEIIGFEGGFDAVWLDHEHAGISMQQVEECSRAARAVGLDSFVRLNATDYASGMRPLEAGGGGVMAAQVRSAKEAADVVRWAKFHPLGLRGVNGSGVDGRYGTIPTPEYFTRANADTFIAIQIEHIDAVNDVEQIAAVKNVDVLFIGPADLGQSMGLVGQWDDPKIWECIERVARAAKKNNIHWAILPRNAAYAQRCLDLGCRMLSIGFDTWVIQRGLKAFQTEFASIHV